MECPFDSMMAFSHGQYICTCCLLIDVFGKGSNDIEKQSS